jgi:hypothetical protein
MLCPETTQKVIAERRLLMLRTMGERAKLCRNAAQLTSALLSVLEQNKEEYAFHLTLSPHLPDRAQVFLSRHFIIARHRIMVSGILFPLLIDSAKRCSNSDP